MKSVDLGVFAEVNPPVKMNRGEEYPFIEMKDLHPSTRKATSSQHKPFKGSGSRFMSGDVLLARITPCLENGKTSQYRDLGRTPAWGSTEFIVLRGKEGISDSDFLYYFCCSPDFRDFAIKNMTGTSGRQRVPSDVVKQYQFAPPRLNEQKAIAATLGALDDKIELNRRANETLEAMARAIFKDWFVDFGPTRAKAEGRAPYLPPELWNLFPPTLDNEGNPNGWHRKPLDEIADFLNGLALQKFPPAAPEDSLPVIKIAELRNGVTPKSNRATRKIPNEYVINDGDFIFSWSGSLLAKFWTGGEGALNQHLFKVTSDHYPVWFFTQWVHHHMPVFQAIAAAKATTMGHIQRGHLKEAMTICPPDDTLSALTPRISPLVDKMLENALESRTLAQTRDLLLPKLISGTIRF